jgi:hypothetical protein
VCFQLCHVLLPLLQALLVLLQCRVSMLQLLLQAGELKVESRIVCMQRVRVLQRIQQMCQLLAALYNSSGHHMQRTLLTLQPE